ncbi:hypothetical protein GIB67_012255 [Kingdonia uniflora]|uniref:KIB1-4 beta-propeller domain-containing protein n=1 Tax=Kingdonia uniflora TaxID=39325 RepID=A0A7J7M931_9MAGN|nr:hypothetical protein GIB67_012255 [Kingdonia uniflora]
MVKVVLSNSPTDDNCVAMAIRGEVSNLAFCKLGDKKWTVLGDDNNGYRRGYMDIIFFKGQFYTLTVNGKVEVCDLGASLTTTTIKSPTDLRIGISNKRYLAEMGGELLIVTRYMDTPSDVRKERLNYYRTYLFEVFRLRLKRGKQRWAKVDYFGDYMLFVGNNSSFSLCAREFPGSRANCIYFTDDYNYLHQQGKLGGHDIGVFNMETGKVNQLPNKTWLLLPTPVWFTLSLR